MQRDFRTWIEIDRKALHYNVGQFLKLIPEKTKFMAVVKSNAYGHGLVQVAKQLATPNPKSNTLNSRLWLGVDSIVEASRLRREGIKNSILVLGSTLPSRIKEAAENGIILTVSSFDALSALSKIKNPPVFHIKIDTGMHRQGFLPAETFSAKGGSALGGKLIKFLKHSKLSPRGIFTHFASAKDIAYPTYTLEQLKKFNAVVSVFKKAGFRNLIRHASASGGTLLFSESHLDMVRVGMGIYGYFPSEESRIKNQESSFNLRPVLTWKTVVSEIKEIPAGSFVGYDLTECVHRKTRIAVLPIGYWHGYDRGLSVVGEVLIRGKRAKVLGRISMDMTVVDVTDIPKVLVGDETVLIGKQVPRPERPGSRWQSRLGSEDAIWADELALKANTSHYEFLTRINPLIKRF